jgi:short-subunit dehydrogenase involved in D-alanine esterification of teichoic acids
MTTSHPIQPAAVLVTGGSEGIGRGLAARYLAAGNEVLITGRSAGKLEKAALELPGLRTLVNDIGKPEEREALSSHVESQLPGLNVVINNAGIQRRVSLASDTAAWPERQAEIDILLSAPLHLNHLLIPLMLRSNKAGMIVNVTSAAPSSRKFSRPFTAPRRLHCTAIRYASPRAGGNIASRGGTCTSRNPDGSRRSRRHARRTAR